MDDSNSTPVLSVEDGHLYLYVSTSFHLGWRSYDTANVPIWKIDAENGEIIWEHEAAYAWSSPVCVYNSDGTGKVLYCSCAGKMYLLDGKTGETHDTCVLSDGAIEASPAVYKDYVVVGTRACKIWGIRLQ